MARNEEGGVLTQKVKALGIVAVMLMAATCFCFAADYSAGDAVNADVTCNKVFVSSGGTTSDRAAEFTLRASEPLYYTATFENESGKQMTDVMTEKKSQLSSTTFKDTVSITAPSTAGKYFLHVKYYNDSERTVNVFEGRQMIKVVDPIVLKVTLKNDSDNDIKFSAYFVINGEKNEKSVQSVSVSAKSTQDVKFDYVVDDVSDTKYMLKTDDAMVFNLAGLNEEKTFYTSQNNYVPITVVLVLVLIVLVVLMVWVYRKPVVNKGKPKGRR